MDEATIEAFGAEVLVSVVGNRKGEFRCRLDLFQPERQILDGLPLILLGTSVPEDPGLQPLIGESGNDFIDGGSDIDLRGGLTIRKHSKPSGDMFNGGSGTDTCVNGETVTGCER